jgi:hypothetical protein
MLHILIFTLLSIIFTVAASPPENHLELIIINNSTLTLTYENTQTSSYTTVDLSTDVIKPKSNITIIAYVDPSQRGDVVAVIHFKCDTQQVSLLIDDRVQIHMGQSIFQITNNELIVSSILFKGRAKVSPWYLSFAKVTLVINAYAVY